MTGKKICQLQKEEVEKISFLTPLHQDCLAFQALLDFPALMRNSVFECRLPLEGNNAARLSLFKPSERRHDHRTAPSRAKQPFFLRSDVLFPHREFLRQGRLLETRALEHIIQRYNTIKRPLCAFFD